MLEKAIKVKSVETTTGGTQVVEFYPVAYSRWIQTPELSEVEVAVQPYGVLMIPAAVVLDSEGLIVQVAIHDYIFEAPLSTIIAADAEDPITFASPYLTLEDLQDVAITSVENGQVLKWDSTAGKWVNGAGGGGSEVPIYYFDPTEQIVNAYTLYTDAECTERAGDPASVDLTTIFNVIICVKPTEGQPVNAIIPQGVSIIGGTSVVYNAVTQTGETTFSTTYWTFAGGV